MSNVLDLSVLLQIEARAFEADSVVALRFTIVNETYALVPFRQAAMFELEDDRFVLVAASGLVSVSTDSPFAVWLSRFVQRLPQDGALHRIDLSDASAEDAVGWGEWLPEHLLLVPLRDRHGVMTGLVLYASETPWSDEACDGLSRLHVSYGYCHAALRGASRRRWQRLRIAFSQRNRWLLVAVACLSLLVPVRLSALAPAEVVGLNAMAVSAPQDGVVGSFAVAPNARVRAGDLLFSLDDASLRSRLSVARKSLEIAQADAHVAQQRAFDDLRSKAEVAAALGRVREKEAELLAVESQARRVEVRADRDGIAIFSDPNDWIGRPVMTGERVMLLAQPEDSGILVWLPVADAINLEQGAPVRLFLHTDPLNPREGTLIEASYQAALSPEGVASYRLRATFAPGVESPRIGLRGTARITGQRVSLGYYLFRRPIAQVRQWVGL